MASITIHLSGPTEQRLRRQAEAAGKPVEQYVSDVLQAQASPGEVLHVISGKVHARFAATGMTEDELAEQLEREDHKARGVPYDE